MNDADNRTVASGQSPEAAGAAATAETPEIVQVVARLLSDRLGGNQEIVEFEQLQGSGDALVWRLRLAPTPFFGERSVVVKYFKSIQSQLDQFLMLREIVAYQFTTALPPEVRPGPYLVAYDVAQRLIVISDSGDGDTFAQMLDSAVPGLRIEILRSLGEAIGKMHAATANQEANFDILIRRMQRKYPDVQPTYSESRQVLSKSIDVGMELLHKHGIVIPPVVADFAVDARRRLLQGQHRAFTPFGITPDNIIVADKPQFLDYENAGFFDSAFDLAGVIAGFPQYPFRSEISDDEADVFIDAWVPEVAKLWPNVQNRDRLHARILTALIGWALMSVTTLSTTLLEMYQAWVEQDGSEVQARPKDLGQLRNLSAPETAERIYRSGVATFPLLLQDAATDDLDEDMQRLLELRDVAIEELIETFVPLERFAQRDGDTRFPVVAKFAGDVLAKLRGLQYG